MTDENFRRVTLSSDINNDRYSTENLNNNDFHQNLENLLPILISNGIISKNSTTSAIKESDMKELAVKWKLKTIDSKTKKPLKKEQLIKSLLNYAEQSAGSTGRREGRRSNNIISTPLLKEEIYEKDSSKIHIEPLKKNYFGLPPWALQRTTDGIIYQGRKPYAEKKHFLSGDEEGRVEEGKEDVQGHGEIGQAESKKTDNVVAQRKVAHALLTMAQNDHMLNHFLQRGGLESIFKLAYDSTDHDVLSTCACCISQAASNSGNCALLLEKQAISVLSTLVEMGDEPTRFQCSRALAALTCQPYFEEVLIRDGIIMVLQSLLNTSTSSTRTDTISYTLLSFCNVAPVLTGPDAESLIRFCMQGARRLDLLGDFESSLFISELFRNLSRVQQYCPLLCEEGVLPLIITILDAQPEAEVIERCSEAFVNLSMMRKNRRDIVGSGIAGQLKKIFSIGETATRANALQMIGNLLSAGMFQEKIAKEEIIVIILDLMDPELSYQFLAASYCICHISHAESTASVMVSCSVIPRLLLQLQLCAETVSGRGRSGDHHNAVRYIWTTFVNLAQREVFIDKLVLADGFIDELCQELRDGEHQREVAQLTVNLTYHEVIKELLSPDQVNKLVLSCKALFVRAHPEPKPQAVSALINLAKQFPITRPVILGNDLISIIEDAGIENPLLSEKYVAIIYLISNEEQCCAKLVDGGVQKLLVSMQSTMGEEGKDLTAATLHNLSIKRAMTGAGVLTTLVNLAKNCKSIRVLWCARCIANISSYPRSRAALAKERKLIPHLAGIMRYGCVEADRVQHYCAIAICNILGTHMEKPAVEELIKSGTITDLVVVTLLRVNSTSTKESLGRALFNLLARADLRQEMVKLDVFEALIGLGNIDTIELLELSVRTVFNISCESAKYSAKLKQLGVPALILGRATSSPLLQGVKATSAVKLQCGMAMANISFDRQLAIELSNEKVADAAHVVFNLHSDEATYCACVTLFNLSKLENCVTLANTSAIPLLVEVLSRGPILCVQLAVAALCNLSLRDVFHDQLNSVSLGGLVKIMASPQIDITIKMDAIHCLYNLLTTFTPSRAVAIEVGAVAALVKLLKSQDENDLLGVIGRIVKELCTEIGLIKKLLSDGVMVILLKLSKIEIGTIKLDISCAIYSLSTSSETLKLLQQDAVDVIFWLTLHDVLGLFDPIKRNVSRAIRNFTVQSDDAEVLCREERFFTVMKAFAKSTNEDVLWQASGILYNLLNTPKCLDTMIKRGAIQLVLDIAVSGYGTVRHLCSACLHSVPEAMPDPDNPVVLELIMCLLDADGELLSELADKTTETLEYSLGVHHRDSEFIHEATDFAASWIPLPCSVDSIFTPASLKLPYYAPDQLSTRPMGTAVGQSHFHKKLTGAEFGWFQGNTRPAKPASPSQNIGSVSGADNMDAFSPGYGYEEDMYGYERTGSGGERHSLSAEPKGRLSIPDVPERPPEIKYQNRRSSRSQSNSIDSGMVGFPRIGGSAGRIGAETPNDTLGAIKGNLYRPKSNKTLGARIQKSFSSSKNT